MFYEGFTATAGYHAANIVLFLGFLGISAALIAAWFIFDALLSILGAIIFLIKEGFIKLFGKIKGLIS